MASVDVETWGDVVLVDMSGVHICTDHGLCASACMASNVCQ